jgi:4-amino-4-deoxy-L-arabinose transferase-like glycosyltransferase
MKFFKIVGKIGNKTDRIYFVFFLILIIFLKLPTMSLDYHWDEVIYASQAKYYSIHGLFSTPPGIIVHVPFFTWFLAINYRIFGESPFLSHFIVAIFSFIGVYFTYLLGKFLYNEKIGIMASLLLFFSPIYFAISGQVLFDVPLTAMTVVVFYFALRKKLISYLISACILVLIKEPGFLVILALLVYELFKKRNVRDILITGLPLLPLLLFGFWYWSQNLLNRNLAFFITQPNFIFIIKRFFANVYQVFIWNYYWILTLFILFELYRKNHFKKKLIAMFTNPIFLSVIFYILLFSFTTLFLLPRYLLPIYPFSFIFSAFSLNTLFKNKNQIILLIIILLFISCYKWNSGIKGFIQDPVFHSKLFYKNRLTSIANGELSLDYIDVVTIHTQAVDFVFKNYPNKTIVASYPLYENASLQINVGYKQWDKYNIKILFPSKKNIDKADLIIFYSLSWTDEMKNLLIGMKPIKTFRVNEQYIDIYKI